MRMRVQDNLGEDVSDEVDRLIGGSEDDRQRHRYRSLLGFNIFCMGFLSLVLLIWIAAWSSSIFPVFRSSPSSLAIEQHTNKVDRLKSTTATSSLPIESNNMILKMINGPTFLRASRSPMSKPILSSLPTSSPTVFRPTSLSTTPTAEPTAPTTSPTLHPTRPHYGPYTIWPQLEADLDKHYLTHDPNCTRALLYHTSWASGFGSQYMNMLLNYVSSLCESRAFVLSRHWLHRYQCDVDTPGGTYSSCFEPFTIGPKTCNATALREMTRKAHEYPKWEMPGARNNATVHSVPVEHFADYHRWKRDNDIPTTIGDHNYTYFELEVYAIKKLWVLNNRTQEIVDKLIEDVDLNGNVCAFHIRWGDKKVEIALRGIEDYVLQAKLSNLQCDTCLFVSDSLNRVKKELNRTIQNNIFSQYLPSCQIRYLESDQFSKYGYWFRRFWGGDQAPRIDHTLHFLASMELFSTANFFISSYSSSMARLAVLLRAAKGWDPGTSASVDIPFWYPID